MNSNRKLLLLCADEYNPCVKSPLIISPNKLNSINNYKFSVFAKQRNKWLKQIFQNGSLRAFSVITIIVRFGQIRFSSEYQYSHVQYLSNRCGFFG